LVYVGQRHLLLNKNNFNSSSPVQNQARAVIRKYRRQLRQIEFKKLQKLVPTIQQNNIGGQEPTEV
jgi:hypothetical protein